MCETAGMAAWTSFILIGSIISLIGLTMFCLELFMIFLEHQENQMNNQPEALLHAEWLESSSNIKNHRIAEELRRLHDVNQEMVEELKEICNSPQFVDDATVPKAGIESAPQQVVMNLFVYLARLQKARSLISKATGEKNE